MAADEKTQTTASSGQTGGSSEKTASTRRTGGTRKTRTARKSGQARSASAQRKTARAVGAATAEENARTASDNTIASDVNERASETAAARAREAAAGEARKGIKLHPDVEKAIFANDGEPLHSINSIPKAEGGLPHDVIVGIRQNLESVRGDSALGQPGQTGHGVGTAELVGTMTEEEVAANEREYAKRVSRSK